MIAGLGITLTNHKIRDIIKLQTIENGEILLKEITEKVIN